MITSYKIKVVNNEEILVIYLNPNEEFSLEYLEKLKEKTIQEFIKYKNITWNGTKIFLVIGGVTLAILNYNPTSNKYNEKFTYVGINNNILSTETVNKVNLNILEANKNEIEKEEIIIENDNLIKEEVNNQDKIDNQTNIPIINKPSNNNTNSNNNFNNNSTSNNSSIPVIKPPNNNNKVPAIKEEITIPDEEENDNNNVDIDKKIYVTVHRNNGQILNLELNDYLIGVVAGEMPASFNQETLKVQAIIARTYVLNAIDKGIQITDTVQNQKYIDSNEMKKLWGTSYNTYYNKIKDVVISTENLVVTYNNNLIECVYHSTSNGKTEDSINVWGNSFPYLQSVDSHWDKNTTSYFRSIDLTKNEFMKKLAINEIEEISIISRNHSDRVDKIKVNDKIYTGVEFRNKLGLRSADFDIIIDGDNIKIDTRGYGHGVGLSQYGSNEMAKLGYNYEQIIKHYYKGVDIEYYT